MSHEPTTSIWTFNRSLSNRLLLWAIGSMVGGLLLQRSRRPLLNGIGAQAVGWGAIDAAIAILGQQSAERKQIVATPLSEVQHARSLRRLLWINTLLDIFYVAAGWWLVFTKGRNNESWRGHGLGIVIQGKFLFVFDLLHARRAGEWGMKSEK